MLKELEELYADDCTMQENSDEPRVGKAACRDYEYKFFGMLEAFHGRTDEASRRLLAGAWAGIDDGYLWLSDRKIDMIISGGVNIYPAEIEAVIHEHPAILDVAVFGIPDDEWGESVYCIVQAKAGEAIDLDDLRAKIADTQVRPNPSAEELAEMASLAATHVQRLPGAEHDHLDVVVHGQVVDRDHEKPRAVAIRIAPAVAARPEGRAAGVVPHHRPDLIPVRHRPEMRAMLRLARTEHVADPNVTMRRPQLQPGPELVAVVFARRVAGLALRIDGPEAGRRTTQVRYRAVGRAESGCEARPHAGVENGVRVAPS